MNPLLIPIALFILGSIAKKQPAAPSGGPKPTPPPGATTAAKRPAPVTPSSPGATAAKAAAVKKILNKIATTPSKKPAVTIEHPDVIPAKDASAQAAVDAAMVQVVKDDAAASSPIPTPMPPPQSSGRTPKKAAADLQAFLIRTGRFGTLKDRPEEVKAAQRDLGLKDDGIVGPKTRAAAKKQGVALPAIK